MTLFSLVQDASDPAGVPLQAGVIVTAGYIGGDTPHIWTGDDWAVWGTRYRIPIWVRSNPTTVDPVADAQACVAALQAIGAPPPYLVLPYGSGSTLFGHQQEDGYWIAAPDGIAQLTGAAGEVAKQFKWGDTFDISIIDQAVPTWDTKTGTGPTAVMIDYETAAVSTYDPAYAAVLHAVPGPQAWQQQIAADLNEIAADVAEIQRILGQQGI